MSLWLFPVLVVAVSVLLSIPVGQYLAWIMDGRYRLPAALRWLEARLDTGPQTWKDMRCHFSSSTSCCSWSATLCWRSSRCCR
jgi:hypothetical protein